MLRTLSFFWSVWEGTALGKFNYGGQAVMEGVMMRGRKHFAVAVREPEGSIVIHNEPLAGHIYGGFVARTPFLRGLTMLWDTLVLGTRSLMFSADVAMREEAAAGDGGAPAGAVAASPAEARPAFAGPVAWGTLVVGLGIGLGLFFLLPAFLVGLADRYLASALLSNVAEGLVRLGLFVGYLAVIGTMPDIQRVFAYHGAEHKTVNAYESGARLIPDEVAAYSTAHPRCGTGFLLLVMVIFIVLGSFLGRPALWLRLLSRIVLIPIVAGLAYEVVKLAASHRQQPLVALVLAPGLWLQRLTTREPDRPMLEVAIAALQRVLESEGSEVTA